MRRQFKWQPVCVVIVIVVAAAVAVGVVVIALVVVLSSLMLGPEVGPKQSRRAAQLGAIEAEARRDLKWARFSYRPLVLY